MEKDDSCSRNDIHIVSRHSNWSAAGIERSFFRSGIYAGKHSWTRFLHFFLIGLGVSFTVAGIIFFFAFNWAGLHRFVKLGLLAGLVIACAMVALLFRQMEEKVRNIFLTAAAMLVGALFAVFGQIYQTGANAYDFFLGWTLAIFLWTIVSGFPVLWFLFLLLCNTTLLLYNEQVVNWTPALLLNLLFLLNALFVIIVEAASARGLVREKVRWLTGMAVIAAVTAITISVCSGIVDAGSTAWGISMMLALAGFGGGLFYGFRARNMLYLAVIPYAILIICITAILKPMHDPVGILLLICMMVVGFTTLLIVQLVKLHKRWQQHEA